MSKRLKILSAAYLSEAGHKRPGVAAGLPMEKAKAQAAELTQQIDIAEERGDQGAGETVGASRAARNRRLFPGTRDDWHGFDPSIQVDGKPVTVVAAERSRAGQAVGLARRILRPQARARHRAARQRISHRLHEDQRHARQPRGGAALECILQQSDEELRFRQKPALVGLSRGGLYCYNWAAANPDKVACIYGDAPVCDFKSWPGGKGKGKGDKRNWDLVLKLWNFKDEDEALAAKSQPGRQSRAACQGAKVPLLHVYGDADDVVPSEENTLLLAERYRSSAAASN